MDTHERHQEEKARPKDKASMFDSEGKSQKAGADVAF